VTEAVILPPPWWQGDEEVSQSFLRLVGVTPEELDLPPREFNEWDDLVLEIARAHEDKNDALDAGDFKAAATLSEREVQLLHELRARREGGKT